jgi:hypothetical protein
MKRKADTNRKVSAFLILYERWINTSKRITYEAHRGVLRAKRNRMGEETLISRSRFLHDPVRSGKDSEHMEWKQKAPAIQQGL